MTDIGLGHYLTLGAIIFAIGIVGIFLNRKNIIRNFMLVVGVIFAGVFSILLINDLELGTITQWTVMSSYFMIIFLIIGIALRITQK